MRVHACAAVRERVDEPDQKRDDQLQEVRVPEEQPGQIPEPVHQGGRDQRAGILRVHVEERDELRGRQLDTID